VGESFQLNNYTVIFDSVERVKVDNYIADQGNFRIKKNEELVTKLEPQKRYYRSDTNPMTEASINTNLWRDLYISLGEPLSSDGGELTTGKTNTWSIRLYYKSFVVWIWLGGFIMAFGALVAMFDRRYRKNSGSSESEA